MKLITSLIVALLLMQQQAILARTVELRNSWGMTMVEVPDTTYTNLSENSPDLLRLQEDLESVMPVSGTTLVVEYVTPASTCINCGEMVMKKVRFKIMYNGLDVYGAHLTAQIELNYLTKLEGQLFTQKPQTELIVSSFDAEKIVRFDGFHKFLLESRRFLHRAKLSYYAYPAHNDAGILCKSVFAIQTADYGNDIYLLDTVDGSIASIMPTLYMANVRFAPPSNFWAETYWGPAYIVWHEPFLYLSDTGWISWVSNDPLKPDAWLFLFNANKWVYWNASSHPTVYDYSTEEWTDWSLVNQNVSVGN